MKVREKFKILGILFSVPKLEIEVGDRIVKDKDKALRTRHHLYMTHQVRLLVQKKC